MKKLLELLAVAIFFFLLIGGLLIWSSITMENCENSTSVRETGNSFCNTNGPDPERIIVRSTPTPISQDSSFVNNTNFSKKEVEKQLKGNYTPSS